MNRLLKSSLALVFVSASLSAFADASLKDIYKDITSIRTKAYAEAGRTGKAPDFAALDAEMKAKAEEAVKGVDVDAIAPKDAFDWAQIYSLAGEHAKVCSLAHKFLTTKPSAEETFQDETLMMASCSALGEGRMLESTLEKVKPTTTDESSELASNTAYDYVATIEKTQGAKEAVKAIEKVSKNLLFADPADDAQKGLAEEKARLTAQNATLPPDADILKTLTTRYQTRNDSVKFTLVESEAEILGRSGQQHKAVDLVSDYIKTLAPDSRVIRTANMAKTRLSLPGTVAPALTFDRQYGDFTGLASLKGKVVIVDTFAHWCGPCKASFPAMRKMYDDLKDKGLEVVGVTNYYGYFGKERGLDQATEYAKMADFRTKFNMDWPIIFGPKSNFESYGISGIPTTFVIDREGKVKTIHVGYDEASFATFRAEVEKLVNEK
jgi:peroxiredoxin